MLKSGHLRRGNLLYRKGSLRMTTSPPSLDPASSEFQARRAEARKIIDAIDPAMQGVMAADSKRQEWFETVYSKAEDDPARVPWANLSAHPLTSAFVEGQIRGITGLRVLDIGCGLGDNAECFAAAGAKVTAFDFVAQAVEWAKRRFPQSKVDYCTADLFALPDEWRGGFDLVHECYTLQAISQPLIPQALGILASLLAPGGKLLLVARARSEDEEVSGPPWPLPPSVFDIAKTQGFEPLVIEDITATANVGRRHWRAVLRRGVISEEWTFSQREKVCARRFVFTSDAGTPPAHPACASVSLDSSSHSASAAASARASSLRCFANCAALVGWMIKASGSASAASTFPMRV